MAKVSKSRLNRNYGPPHGATIRGSWWKHDKEKIHEAVRPLVQILRDEQEHRDYYNRMFYSMFVGQGVYGLEGDRYALRANHEFESLMVNVARAIASAANSKLAKDKVRILYLTEGGNWSQQSRAKRITKVVNGTFHSSGFYTENAGAQRDSCVFDLGAVYFYAEGEDVKCMRVPGNEIRVDYMDGRYGRPTSLHREVVIPRTTVAAMYPEHAESINAATLSRETSQTSRGNWVSDSIDVTYSWHLPSGPDEDDGVFCVTTSNSTLECEEYKHAYYPFVFHRWEESPFGFYGQSICHIVAGVQYSINKVVADIQEHVDLSTGFVAVESGAGFNKASLQNVPWAIYEYTGSKVPEHVIPPALSMQKVEWLNWLVNRAHEDTGLSQLFVTSRKPDGLDSGKALREYNDQNSERFQMAQQRFEESHVQAARVITGLYEEIYEGEGNFEIKAHGQKNINSISWEKARMDEKDYAVRPVPTSFLPSTPSAKLQTIQEMLQGGMLGREEAMMLLDYPDLERINTLQGAPLLNIEWRLEQMLDPDEPKYLPPEPNMNLQLAMRLTGVAYNDAQSNGAPEKNLELLLRFESQLQELIDRSAAPPPLPTNGAVPPEALPPALPPAPPIGPDGLPIPQGPIQ